MKTWAALRELDRLVWWIVQEYPSTSVPTALCLAYLKKPHLWTKVHNETGEGNRWPLDVHILNGDYNVIPGFMLPWWKGIEIGEGPWWELYDLATDRWCPDGPDEDLPWSAFLKRTVRARPDLWAQVVAGFPALFGGAS